jgi:hypothetical protein
MPKLPFDYSKTVIYKIVCNDLTITDCYIGHTTDFIRRKQTHKNSVNNENSRFNLKVYKFIREHGGWNNWSMIEVEKYPCNDINEATARERYWFENLKATLNCNIPNRTIKEWNEEYKEHLKEYKKEYGKEYYEENKEQILEYKKEYYEENKEQILEYKKEYYKKNKEKNFEKIKEKFTCDCGGKYTRVNKSAHEKTKKHLIYVNKNT